jgi:NAD(P)-dependent dehydrogenase (short-subunit alcohol dehydrogenase family)
VASTQSVSGKRILITGAARGIGADAAQRLAARGAKVALVGLEPEALAVVATACGPHAIWAEADVTDWDALRGAVDAAVERFGGLDVVVANAGIGVGGLAGAVEPWAFERVLEVNLLGVWRTVRTCLPHILDSRGYILNIGSIASLLPMPGGAAYGMAKAGVESFSRALHMEVASRGVDVGVAYFSWLASDLVRSAEEHPAFARMREQMSWPFNKTYPVSLGAEAIVRGIEQRARIVVAPRWVRALLPLRELLARGMERQVIKMMPEIEALAQAERDRVGAEAASMPVGPGGAAAARAAGHDPVAAGRDAGADGAAGGEAVTAGGVGQDAGRPGAAQGDPVAPAG